MTNLASIEQIIKDAANGKMFILCDDESRENEGDLIIPAEMADKEAVNFMAKYGRGLICLALEKEQVEKLGLPPMARHNSSRHQTAFTVSIEAREGITTGISAADRATTIGVAINPQATASEISMPGHIFPLQARDGGVLVRAGHTEAAVDIARLAGLKPAGVICEVMNDDGSMARMDDLVPFAKEHGLNIATIADLIAYRRRKEKLVERVKSIQFNSQYGGEFLLHLYVNKLAYAEHVVLVKGDVDYTKPVLVRMHALDVMQDVLGAEKSGQLQRSMEIISEAGSGIIVLIREPKRDQLSDTLKRLSGESDTASAPLRDYGIGAQILLDLGVKEMTLLTNSTKNVIALDGYDLEIVGTKKI